MLSQYLGKFLRNIIGDGLHIAGDPGCHDLPQNLDFVS